MVVIEIFRVFQHTYKVVSMHLIACEVLTQNVKLANILNLVNSES